MKKVQLITDGACLGNPGPGGWAAVLRFKELKKEIWNSEKHTTNNRMELTAAIEGLKSLREQCEVEVVTDSEYVKNGITTWIHVVMPFLTYSESVTTSTSHCSRSDFSPSIAAVSSMRLLVVCFSEFQISFFKSLKRRTAAQPPGPGLPRQAPSVMI